MNGEYYCKLCGDYLCNDNYSIKEEMVKVLDFNNTDFKSISERVNQLRDWGIEFIHGDILDKDLVNKYCKDADIIHHLAGITDVPRVKSESNEDNN